MWMPDAVKQELLQQYYIIYVQYAPYLSIYLAILITVIIIYIYMITIYFKKKVQRSFERIPF